MTECSQVRSDFYARGRRQYEPGAPPPNFTELKRNASAGHSAYKHEQQLAVRESSPLTGCTPRPGTGPTRPRPPRPRAARARRGRALQLHRIEAEHHALINVLLGRRTSAHTPACSWPPHPGAWTKRGREGRPVHPGVRLDHSPRRALELDAHMAEAPRRPSTSGAQSCPRRRRRGEAKHGNASSKHADAAAGVAGHDREGRGEDRSEDQPDSSKSVPPNRTSVVELTETTVAIAMR